MSTTKVGTILLILSLAILSGLGDSQGFVHSAKIWANGRIEWHELVRASVGYSFGILMYWLALKFLNEIAIVSAEVQALGWFVVTIVGVGLVSGSFFRWRVSEQTVSLGVLAGLAWLFVRTSR